MVKKWINENIDHQFVIDSHDPLYQSIVGSPSLVPVYVPETDYIAGYKIDLSDLTPNTPEYEYQEGFLIVDFVPTSENLSEWMAKIVDSKMYKLDVKVHHIDWWETPKSRSVFYPH